jgi:hypothetical protein
LGKKQLLLYKDSRLKKIDLYSRSIQSKCFKRRTKGKKAKKDFFFTKNQFGHEKRKTCVSVGKYLQELQNEKESGRK